MKYWAALILFVVLAGLGCKGAGSDSAQQDGTQSAPPDTRDDGLTHGLTEEQAGEVLAKVGDRVITVGEFANRLASQSPYLRARFESPERRKDFLNDLIRFELLVHEAKRRGYDQKPEVVRARRHAVVQQFLRTKIDDKLQLDKISDEDIRKAYEANPDEYNRPAQRRVSHILVRDQARAKQVLAEAKEAKTVDDFRNVARKYTEDEKTKPSGGDLQFFTKASKDDEGPDPAIRRAAFGLDKITAVYPTLVKTDKGFHVLMLTGKRNALTRTFDQAKRAIRHKIAKERKDAAMKDLLAQLKKEIPVSIDESALAELRVQTQPTPPKTP